MQKAPSGAFCITVDLHL